MTWQITDEEYKHYKGLQKFVKDLCKDEYYKKKLKDKYGINIDFVKKKPIIFVN